MTESQARQRLLDAAVQHALDAGIADLSLRELAEAIGTSHRMLIYHFGSREGLFVAVAQAVEQTQRELAFGSLTRNPPEDARAFWKRISSPKLWPQERLFFELYVHALLGRPGTEGFLDDVVESWIGPIADAVVAQGGDRRTARADARLAVAVVRGLILDLLATGDSKGCTDAFDRYLARVGVPGVATS
jgi:AcrR family transcriptional regulator